jgi:hypothetical protein
MEIGIGGRRPYVSLLVGLHEAATRPSPVDRGSSRPSASTPGQTVCGALGS